MDAGFCAEALGDALARYGQPEIFNTDQGSQFTSLDFTGVLKNASIRISMDGRGRCMDIFIESLWRSLKYEAVYLHELTDGFHADRVIGEWIGFYNTERPHSSLDGQSPAEAYGAGQPVDMMDKARALPALPNCPTKWDHLSRGLSRRGQRDECKEGNDDQERAQQRAGNETLLGYEFISFGWFFSAHLLTHPILFTRDALRFRLRHLINR